MTATPPDRRPKPAKILVLQHDSENPPEHLGDWLTAAGADLDVRRLFAGDQLPDDTSGHDAVISLGGAMGADDDAGVSWLTATKKLLAGTAESGLPTLGVCLGSQLLASATGGRVTKGDRGPEIGAFLIARRDAAAADPLFAELPLTPDVMQCHDDTVAELPPGAVLLASNGYPGGYPHQAFRVGPAAWGVQFHIETSAARVRDWAKGKQATALPIRLGSELDEAESAMDQVWRAFAARFVSLAEQHRDHPGGRRLDLPLAP
ncbi:type 1 glutamine amidotransferase [Nakamurella aerolata]|uniref:Type 1 glutamine amidotransferase n=1 Tax=Nakamurella aerolata TaxID=1656892 RepID=A0A849A1W2_9ACTN|nr:type 1 glutamine amidotransferase [Nakamurella aerolata]NNG34609.1 type 1 glutamine amidotransferase [Nakamurella aerolata]